MEGKGMARLSKFALGTLVAILLGSRGEAPGKAPRQAAGMVFQQAVTDGLVVMEAENFRVNNPGTGSTDTWTLQAAPAGASGDAMQALPDDGTSFGGSFTVPPAPFEPNISPRLDFRVLFVATGTHYVWVRGRGLDGASDSCHVGLDGAAVASAERINGYTLTAPTPYEWRTITMSGPVATLTVASAGLHTVNLWMREDGFIADRVLLTTNAAYAGVTNAGTMIGPAESSQVPDPTPAAPVLSGTPGAVSANLSWTAVTGATSYNVLRSTTSGSGYALVANVAGTTYLDANLPYGPTYYYVVQAVNAFGTSANSNQVTIVPLPPPPKTTTSGSNNNLSHRCGCDSIAGPAGAVALGGAALLAFALAFMRRR